MSTNMIPQVGQQGFFRVGSDRYPVSVVSVSKTGAKVTVRRDRVTAWADSRGVSFEVDANGEVMVFHRKKSGAYESDCCWLHVGHGHQAYHDPCF